MISPGALTIFGFFEGEKKYRNLFLHKFCFHFSMDFHSCTRSMGCSHLMVPSVAAFGPPSTMLCPCCDCRDRIYTSRMSRHDGQSMKTPPPPPHCNQSTSWTSRVWRRIVCSRPIGWWVYLALGIMISMNHIFSAIGINDTSSRLGDENSALRLDLAFLTENLKPVDELKASSDDIDSNHSSVTTLLKSSTTEHESSHTSTNSSTLLIVYERNKITSLPPHVVNHHIVNMNGRKQLGQTEKIILVGMPKSGTTTVSSFFKESKRYRVCDFQCPLPVDTAVMGNQTDSNNTNNFSRQYIGKCMARAKLQNLPLIKTCGDYDMYGQLDFPMPRGKTCQLPQITLLQDFHKEHPDATFILNLRNASHWTSSVHRWRGMHRRLPQCALGPEEKSHVSLRQWYYLHVQRIRHFVTLHPSHALVEIDVEHEATGKRMAAIFGINETCWGHRNAHPKKAKKRKQH